MERNHNWFELCFDGWLFCSALCLCSMEIGIEIRRTIVFLTSHPHINIDDQC